MAIKSANDVAVAMAEKLGGTESRFAALMTLRAKELGMQNTHFVNASGLPDSRQISTARDIAIMSRAVMRDYPQYYKLFSQQQFTFRGQTMGNHNHLLGRMEGVDGLKTGFTNASGYNLAVSGVRDGRRLIGVVLGGSSNAARDKNAQDLLLTGFSIMERRARGEKITVAQNMFEPEPTGPIMQPSIEQGDGDQEGERIQLASATPASRFSNVKIVEPDKTALKKNAKAEKADADDKKKAKGKWTVQVGAFKSKADAKEQLGFVKQRFGKQFAKADGLVAERSAGSYPSRFQGFDERSAKAACGALKAKRLACQVIAPG
jgi:D-alanyl-D-alanine carboxypeptidase